VLGIEPVTIGILALLAGLVCLWLIKQAADDIDEILRRAREGAKACEECTKTGNRAACAKCKVEFKKAWRAAASCVDHATKVAEVEQIFWGVAH